MSTQGFVDVVVYCDGTPGSLRGDRTPSKPHAPVPIAAYRRLPGGWISLAYAVFNGIEFSAHSSTYQLGADGPIPRPTIDRDDGEYFDLAAYGAHQKATAEARDAGDQLRPHYQWRCRTCGYHVEVNTTFGQSMFDRMIHADAKVTLAQFDRALSDEVERRN